MGRAYYSSRISNFLTQDVDYILGHLLIQDEFQTTDLQKNAWKFEIALLQEKLHPFSDGDIAFEYTIPRLGHRIDVVCIIKGVIFVLEFKIGSREHKRSTIDQVMDYVLDLKYFHQKSENRYIVPIDVSTEAPDVENQIIAMDDCILHPLLSNANTLARDISSVLEQISDTCLNIDEWINSRYSPTPTIIEAAQTLYRNHSVVDISRNDAGAQNLTSTTKAISAIIDNCKEKHKKAICFVTGVPGAGKTLAGLNIANERHKFEADEHAVFLSGNGPLVDVLQTALAKDKSQRDGITLDAAKRETKAFIQIIHKFRDEALATNEAPIEKVAIFDEAQRAWDAYSLSNFMSRKKGVHNFNQSEPDFLISIMDRHKDWAVIICLVGGGQEIYTGEAGISDWFKALHNKYKDWDIYLSDKMSDSEYIGSSTISELLSGRPFSVIPSLHLGVSLRSFRSEKLSAFVKTLLDNKPDEAYKVYSELKYTYPIYMTRNFEAAKKWVKSKSRGNERYGLLASSEGKRLRGIGIWVPTEINHVGWFLNDKEHVDSSFFLEVAASEFKVQGLEIDYGILAWDADLRYVNNEFDFFRFRGSRWTHINVEQRQRYLKNAYRVLLTRARQGLVIFVPEGADPEEDMTRSRLLYDEIFNYFKKCGIVELDASDQ